MDIKVLSKYPQSSPIQGNNFRRSQPFSLFGGLMQPL